MEYKFEHNVADIDVEPFQVLLVLNSTDYMETSGSSGLGRKWNQWLVLEWWRQQW